MEMSLFINFNYRAVKENLRVVLSVSSSASKFQQQCRDFPGLTNCISIMFFPHWSRENLILRASELLQGMYCIVEHLEFRLVLQVYIT